MSHTTTSGDRADSERGKYWEKLAEEYGASYAVVIDHAGQLQKALTVDTAPEGRTDETELLDADRALARIRGALEGDLVLDRLRAAMKGRLAETARDINDMLGRVRGLLMLAGMRAAAVEILKAKRHTMKPNAADKLVGVHIWRMARHIHHDTQHRERHDTDNDRPRQT